MEETATDTARPSLAANGSMAGPGRHDIFRLHSTAWADAHVFSPPRSSHPALFWDNPAVPSSFIAAVKKVKDLLSRKRKLGHCKTTFAFSPNYRDAVMLP